MDDERETTSLNLPGGVEHLTVSVTIAAAGPHAVKRFMEFFAATIRIRNTRGAYINAVGHFLRWCEDHGVMDIRRVEPLVVACYVETLAANYSKPTVKQRLAAVRTLFDWLVTGQVVPFNPAASVRGPSLITARGKTPVLTAEQTRELLDSIPVGDVCGLRDRALIAVMVFSFARVSAAVGLRVRDYFPEGKRWRLRLHEKGGKEHVVPCHHVAEEYIDRYMDAAGIPEDDNGSLFRTIDPHGAVTLNGMTRNDAFRMVKRRARSAGLPGNIGWPYRSLSALRTTYAATLARVLRPTELAGNMGVARIRDVLGYFDIASAMTGDAA